MKCRPLQIAIFHDEREFLNIRGISSKKDTFQGGLGIFQISRIPDSLQFEPMILKKKIPKNSIESSQ